ncbi:MAG TPA: hypothetical protein EYO33_23335 [Phycisphaerales bacterium]|nr:hypothetical protein [Phycisphaerales bacterium]
MFIRSSYLKIVNFSGSRAYSVLEVLIAIWLLTFIGGSLVATFAYLAKSASVSADRAAAELLADELLERAVASGPPSWGLADLSGTRGIVLESGGETKFDWTLTPHELGNSGLGRFYQLSLEIDWAAHQDSVERGSRRLHRIRNVYLERL